MDEKKRRKRRHDKDTSESSSSDEEKSRKTERKSSESQQIAKKRSKKRSRDEKQNSSCSTSSSDSGSEHSPSSDLETKKKKRKHAHKDKLKRRKKEKRKRKRERKEKKSKRRKEKEVKRTAGEKKDVSKDIPFPPQATDTLKNNPVSPDHGSDIAPKKRSMVPMTKEEYEKQQAQVRRVYDPETGRHRLVKGTGEILEEIVSRDRHKAINKTATQGDGAFFQANLGLKDR